MSKGDVAKGFMLGAASVLAVRAILKALPAGGPIARALGRGGIVLAEKAREAAAEIGEVLEDAVAELGVAEPAESAANDPDTGEGSGEASAASPSEGPQSAQ